MIKAILSLIMFIACLVPNIATAKSLKLPPKVAAEPISCEDTPAPDPVSRYETLPVHIQLAEYIWGYGKPNRLTCQSRHFKYEASRNGDQIKVVSLYKKSGHPHAEYLAVKNDKISGWYKKHGVITAFWPNGKKQAVEYYFNGFPVGFHRYFDKTGKLIYVADYTGSDYELEKRIGVGELRKFYQGTGSLRNVSLAQKTQLFREVYAIENEQAVRKAFASAGLFNPPWIALDPASTLEQWTKPGNQGEVLTEHRLLEIVNAELDYLPFFEVYLRARLALPSLREPKSYNPEILNSPWIDEAMQLGLKDERFKFKPVAHVTDAEIAATPQNRYAKCRTNPNTDCLFEQVAENLQFEQSHKDTYVSKFALAALAAGYPEWTRKIMTAILAEGNSSTRFAELASLKAQAEWALKLYDDAQRSTEKAFDIAFTEQAGSHTGTYAMAIEAVIPLFLTGNPVESNLALTYYKFAETQEYPNALGILENTAVAQARQGNIQEAMRLANAFFLVNKGPQTAVSIATLPAYQARNPHLYASVMLALAEGRIDRGDTASARKVLHELEQTIPSHQNDTELAARASVLYARLGDIEEAIGTTQNISRYDYRRLEDVAVALCKTGEQATGQTLAVKMLELEKSNGSKKTSPRTKAKLAKIEYFCGNKEKAKADFAHVLQEAKEFPCHSDFCDIEGLVREVKLTILDTGWLDPIWQRDMFDDALMNLKIAVQRAEQGDASAALVRLDELDADKPRHIGDSYQFMYILAKAQVLTILDRDSEADAEFAQAKRIALNYNDHRDRAKSLLELAKTQYKLRNFEAAKENAKEAFAELAVLPQGYDHFRGRDYDTGIIKILTQTGTDSDALAVAFAFLDDDPYYLGKKVAQKQGRFRILAEVALTQLQRGENTDSLEAIAKVQPLWLRIKAWQRALAIAENQQNENAQAFVKQELAEELDNLPDSLDLGTDNQAKRQTIHEFANVLRMKLLTLNQERQIEIIGLLVEQARLMSENQVGAKALCELAYTAQTIQQPALAKALFNEGATLASKHNHFDVPALGACAYWLKTSGDLQRANTMIGDAFKRIPEGLESMGLGHIGTLLNIAIASAEYEKGEIFWPEYSH